MNTRMIKLTLIGTVIALTFDPIAPLKIMMLMAYNVATY